MGFDKQYDYILVRYGELSTKGKNKKDFITQLVRNVKYALKEFSLLEYKADRDRLYIYLHDTDPTPVEEKLKNVFGIRSFSLAIRCPRDMEEMEEAVLSLAKEEQEKGIHTFKMKARRTDKTFPFTSDEINRNCATRILKNTDLKVDVHNPELPIIVEVHRDYAYVMAKTVLGAGGYPVRVGGKALLLLSGGIDSPVAGHEIMKRGVAIEGIHFTSMPYTSQQAKDKVVTLANKISQYQGRMKIHMISFTELQLAIYEHCPENYAITIMRRMMVRIATEIAKQNHCLALVTGESIGQVASQTLESISVINHVTDLPVIRPLATWDKLDIIDLSKKIDTYETSILPFEDCCTIFTPKDPVTKPRLDRCEEYEKRWDWQPMIEKAIEGHEIVYINDKE